MFVVIHVVFSCMIVLLVCSKKSVLSVFSLSLSFADLAECTFSNIYLDALCSPVYGATTASLHLISLPARTVNAYN
jgi:hypothetical protein